ncbi:peptidoglycan D,D-transpeptidase FtsI family protein [Salisediminibacterium selenitireducens]|uniref:serine-type D-Ala-D-Ala carboxypeptidase n=1 Tax=Bacillus selenitireducens (strain ATCC 700615 / DSM 15326 / MLS10) TaxID=439292 RepID=D6XW67_BACIE|nr:penicillin-binding protein 2 [Salisediminibacterium selenitireducens]ADH99821.1 penicillin-binding protein transpeptidase [[Bacillus] selenitireducens MLS10]
MAKQKRMKPHIPLRLNLLFFLVFILFSALILRLGVVQIVQGEEFQEVVERTNSEITPVEAPRGLVYDRHGNLLVGNEHIHTVTFTNRRTSAQEMLDVSLLLSDLIDVDTDHVFESRYEQERRDFWSVLYDEEFEDKLPLEEAQAREMSDGDVYRERIDAITDQDLEMVTDQEWEAFAVWRELRQGMNNVPHKISSVSHEEAARIMENMENLPGIDVIRDAERVYPFGSYLRGILGNVGSIRSENLDQFLSQGYERTDRVGTTYLEAQYESVLRGRPGSIETFTDSDGNHTEPPVERQGSRGNDLMLSFDLELQQRVEDLVDSITMERSGSFVAEPDAHVVMMEPDTGDILAMYGNGSTSPPMGQSYEMGSTVKGATLLTGYNHGLITPGEVIVDRPTTLGVGGGGTISSVVNMGAINDLQALERSSNIYMATVAMRLVGYTPGVSTSWGSYQFGYDWIRQQFGEFGLGVSTGIDLPGESTGIVGQNISQPGNMVFLTYGQYDTYTPLQLAQYTATIANDGVRVAPRVVTEIREPSNVRGEIGPVAEVKKPKIMNIIDTDPSYFDRIKEGFYRVVYGDRGTARAYFQNRDYTVGGKTGTAQSFYDGQSVNNQTFVAFAPFDEPEVVISVVVPFVSTAEGNAGIANTIAEAALDAYFDLQEGRNGPREPESSGDEDESSDDES